MIFVYKQKSAAKAVCQREQKNQRERKVKQKRENTIFAVNEDAILCKSFVRLLHMEIIEFRWLNIY